MKIILLIIGALFSSLCFSGDVIASDEGMDVDGFSLLLEEHGVEVHASIEVEYRTEEGFDDTEGGGSTTSNTDKASLDVEFGYQPCGWFRGDIFLTWDDETPLEIEEGFVTIGDTDSFPLFTSAGKMTLPFGLYETEMISDPLSQELGEFKTYSAVLGAEWQGLYTSTFFYDGSTINGDDVGRNLKVFGAGAGYLYDEDDLIIRVGGGWLENIADSDGFSEFLHEERLHLKDRAPGAVVYSLLGYGPVILSFEYVTALEHIEVIDEEEVVDLGRSKAWAAELSYSLELSEVEFIMAIAYGESGSLGDLLPEKRFGGTMAIFPLKYLKLGFEYLREYDYSVSKGGTGDEANIVTFQMGLEY